MERPVNALPMLHPPATVPPNPMSKPPKNRRRSSGASGNCQRAAPIERALSHDPKGTPRSMKAPQVMGWSAWSTSTAKRVRLGPVIDKPQCHPDGAPKSQASVPKNPMDKPVWYQGQMSGVGEGLGSLHSRIAIKTTPPKMIPPGLIPSSVGIEAASASKNRGWVSHVVAKRKRPCAASRPPMAKPNTATAAPRFPVPTRDQMEVAQPLAHTIPKPNMRPPTTAANQVNAGTGTMRRPAPSRAFTRKS